MKRAVVLLSGGIDSTTTLAIAIAEGYDVHALSFDYGQRHQIETEAARRVADSLGAKEHRMAKIDLRVFGRSALTDSCSDRTLEGLACGECDSCLLRLKGFREAEITDPIRYAKK